MLYEKYVSLLQIHTSNICVCVRGRKCLQHTISKGVNIINIEKKTSKSWKYKNSPIKKGKRYHLKITTSK